MSERTDDMHFVLKLLELIEARLSEIKQLLAEKNARQVCKHLRYEFRTNTGAHCLDCDTYFTWEEQRRDRQWNWQPPQ